MEKTNDIIVIHYDSDKPEAYVWFHREEWLKYKEFCDEQERKFARWFFTGDATPKPTYLEEWRKLGRERILFIPRMYRRPLLSSLYLLSNKERRN